jgi:GAF domain-containing protein
MVANNPAEYAALGFQVIPGTDQSLSSITVPIVGSDRVLGSIALENYERENAFGEGEVRLLSTVAASMGVALESARLFDETQRLLKETEQRAAELAIINSVQEGLASKLDMQAIYDLVGEKLSEVMHSQDIDIRLYDPASNQVFFPYLKDNGKRLTSPPTPLAGVAKVVIESRQMWLANQDMERRMAEVGSSNIPGTQMEKSFVAVPIIAGDRVMGMVGVGDYEKENAFSDSDLRLLQTVVSAMSVALENARLFDETQRLLKETEQRAAELAVINSIQLGMAAKLDFQAIIVLVGAKLREVFHTGDIGIRWFDYKERIVHYLYDYEHGKRLVQQCAAQDDQLGGADLAARAPGYEHRCGDGRCRRHSGYRHVEVERIRAHHRQRPRNWRHHCRKLRARIRVRRAGGAAADHGRIQHGRRTGERATVRRDSAAAQGNRAARRGARDHQFDPAGAGGRAEFRRSSSLSATSCDVFKTRTSRSAGTRKTGLITPVQL